MWVWTPPISFYFIWWDIYGSVSCGGGTIERHDNDFGTKIHDQECNRSHSLSKKRLMGRASSVYVLRRTPNIWNCQFHMLMRSEFRIACSIISCLHNHKYICKQVSLAIQIPIPIGRNLATVTFGIIWYTRRHSFICPIPAANTIN